jgi:hypothetical protein
MPVIEHFKSQRKVAEVRSEIFATVPFSDSLTTSDRQLSTGGRGPYHGGRRCGAGAHLEFTMKNISSCLTLQCNTMTFTFIHPPECCFRAVTGFFFSSIHSNLQIVSGPRQHL